jgi:hypothetical protein
MTNKLERWEKWEKQRAKGKWNFVLVYGVLGWGVTCGVLFGCVCYAKIIPIADRQTFLPFASIVFVFSLAGLVWGAAMWTYLEMLYRKENGLHP